MLTFVAPANTATIHFTQYNTPQQSCVLRTMTSALSATATAAVSCMKKRPSTNLAAYESVCVPLINMTDEDDIKVSVYRVVVDLTSSIDDEDNGENAKSASELNMMHQDEEEAVSDSSARPLKRRMRADERKYLIQHGATCCTEDKTERMSTSEGTSDKAVEERQPFICISAGNTYSQRRMERQRETTPVPILVAPLLFDPILYDEELGCSLDDLLNSWVDSKECKELYEN